MDKRFIAKLLIFVAPFGAALLVELFLLPVDAFTFRSWEALIVHGGQWVNALNTRMKLYPLVKLDRVDTGELGHHTIYAQPRHVIWETDEWGFRNRPGREGPFDVVIVGDSMTAGANLSQDETLAVQLEARSSRAVYSYAPAQLAEFLEDERFLTQPRPVVVYQFLERDLVLRFQSLASPKAVSEGATTPTVSHPEGLLAMRVRTFVFLNRFMKGAMLEAFRAQLRREVANAAGTMLGGTPASERPGFGAVVGPDGKSLYVLPDWNRLKFPDAIVDLAHDRLVEFHRAIEDSGFRFIGLVIPNKETIEYRLLGDERPSDLLDRSMRRWREAGIDVVDLRESFFAAQQEGLELYHRDDSHWAPDAVRIAAGALAERLGGSASRASEDPDGSSGGSR